MILVIFTQDYPYGRGEPFLESEIAYASQNFDAVHIISSSRNQELTRELPSNVYAHKVGRNYRFTICLLYAFFKLFSVEARSEWKFLSQNRCLFKKSHIIKSWIIYWMLEKRYALYISQLNLPTENAIAYAYWMDSRAYFIAKHRHLWRFAISRAHRFEIQETIYIPSESKLRMA